MRARKRLFSKFPVAMLTVLRDLRYLGSDMGFHPGRCTDGSSLSKAQVVEGYGQLPLSFTENQGQTDSQVKFMARGQGQAVFFTSEGMVLSLNALYRDKGKKKKAKSAVIQLRPEGMRPGVEILATEPLEGKVNYYQGNDPAKWRTNVPTYKSVLYREAYPGIDLKFYGCGQQMEYDLIIKPGADPKQVKFLLPGY